MDCILFSANPRIAEIPDAIDHLVRNEKLYFEVKFPIRKTQFSFPMAGFIHISGDRIRYVARIEDILPFSREHYETPNVAEAVKPVQWLKEWKENTNNIRFDRWKNALVITIIVPFEYDTYLLQKGDGKQVVQPPQGYVKVLPPSGWSGFRSPPEGASA